MLVHCHALSVLAGHDVCERMLFVLHDGVKKNGSELMSCLLLVGQSWPFFIIVRCYSRRIR